MKEAGALWIKRCREKQLEASTQRGYEEHTELHIYPFVGGKKLSELTMPAVGAFADQLRDAGRSGEMIQRVVRSLGAIVKEASRRGLSNLDPTAARTHAPPLARPPGAKTRPKKTRPPTEAASSSIQ